MKLLRKSYVVSEIRPAVLSVTAGTHFLVLNAKVK